MRNFRLIISMALLIMLVSAVSVSAQETTADVTIGVKALLVDGNTWPGTFEANVEAHLYAFAGSEGDVVTISMTQSEDGELDPYLVLLGPNGEVIASDDDSGTDLFLSSLIDDAELPADGTYFILATSYGNINRSFNLTTEDEDSEDADSEDNENEGEDQQVVESYELTLTGPTPPAEASPVSITPITIGETLEGESTAKAPVGYYVFEGSAGDIVSVFVASNDFDTIAQVFGPNGDRIAANDDDSVEGGLNSAIRELQLPEDGVYLIFASKLYFYDVSEEDEVLDSNSGTFTVTLQ